MAKKKTDRAPASVHDGCALCHAEMNIAKKRAAELEAVMQELVEAICAVRDGMRKESLEALPPTTRIAVDLALVHAKRLGAKGLETEPPAGQS